MSIEPYRDLVRAALRGELKPDEFERRFDALPPAPTAYAYANRFKAMMDAGRTHADGFAYWLKAALPYLKVIIESEPDELDVGERLHEFWDEHGYFRPASSSRYERGEHSMDDARYVALIVDPDNALSMLVSVRRFTPGCDLAPAEAPQGGSSHVVLVPSDFSWLMHEEYSGGEPPVRHMWLRVAEPVARR